MKRVLILGSSGFIGGPLVKMLVDKGYHVHGVDIKNIHYDIFTPTIFTQGDLCVQSVIKEIFTKDYIYDEVYQLAMSSNVDDTYNYVRVNMNILTACIEFKVKKVLFVTELCSTNNILDLEFMERMYSKFQSQLNICSIRICNVIGDYSSCTYNRYINIARDVALCDAESTIKIHSNGDEGMHLVHVSDCINGLYMAMTSDCAHVLNICSNERMCINDYVKILLEISGKKLTVNYVSDYVLSQYEIAHDTYPKNWSPDMSLFNSVKNTYDYIHSLLSNRPVVGFISQKIGYLNDSSKSYCGVGIRGKLTSDILSKNKSLKYVFVTAYLDSNIELEKFIKQYKPRVIVYNYHENTTKWLNNSDLRKKYNNIKHMMIHYDLLQNDVDNFNSTSKFCDFKYVITDNDKINCEKAPNNVFIVSRSVPFTDCICKYPLRADPIPIIGFQGFGFYHKGIKRLAQQIEAEFDNAIFRLHLPFSYYGDRHGHQAQARIAEVRSVIKKPGIRIEISHDFMTDDEIVKWLHKNTINCYLFDYQENAGIASSPDYAIAAYRPIAVSDSRMLVNLHNLTPSIEIEKNTLKQIIENGIAPLEPIYKKYACETVVSTYEKVCDTVLSFI